MTLTMSFANLSTKQWQNLVWICSHMQSLGLSFPLSTYSPTMRTANFIKQTMTTSGMAQKSGKTFKYMCDILRCCKGDFNVIRSPSEESCTGGLYVLIKRFFSFHGFLLILIHKVLTLFGLSTTGIPLLFYTHSDQFLLNQLERSI